MAFNQRQGLVELYNALPLSLRSIAANYACEDAARVNANAPSREVAQRLASRAAMAESNVGIGHATLL